MGSSFFRQEPVFRASVLECEALLREIGMPGMLANFDGTAEAGFFEDEARVMITTTIIQIALYDLWKSLGIEPNVIMGLSLGEVTAAYAAGALDKKGALKISASYAMLSRLDRNDYIVLYVQCGIEQAHALALRAPVWFTPIYDIADQHVLVFCGQHDAKQLGRYLDDAGIVWRRPHDDTSIPYHTELMRQHHTKLAEAAATAELRPFRYPFYSCVYGDVLPAGSVVGPEFWPTLTEVPVYARTVLQALHRDGISVLLHIGPHPFLKGQIMSTVSSGQAKAIVLDSMNRHDPELDTFRKSCRQLKRLRLSENNYINNTYKNNELEFLLGRFNLGAHVAQDPYPYFHYLRRHGRVHYLPALRSWLVLDHALIEQVLKQPAEFSSSLHSSFDSLLLGADPPHHTVVRSLLQPLFSAPAFAALGPYTSDTARALIDACKEQDQVNFVDAFSIPLARAVIARFLGFTEAEAEELKDMLTGHTYSMGYLPQLESFCRTHLMRRSAADKDAAGLLLTQVQEGALPFDGAVSLLRMLWIAGMTTTSMLLSSAVHLLARNPDVAEALRRDEQLIPKFIEECLRLEAPESELRRLTTRELVLDGQTLPQGSVVMLGIRAANHDPAYFTDPEEIRFDRTRRHLSFGGGFHYCLGVGMARTEARHAVKVLLECLPQLKLRAGRPVHYFPSPHFRALDTLLLQMRSPIYTLEHAPAAKDQ